MSRGASRTILAAALAACLTSSAWLHRVLLRRDPLYLPAPNDALYLPKPELFRATSFGFNQLAADLLWMKLVQAVGDLRSRATGFKYIRAYTDIVTDVDPRYAAPYLAANFWLVGWDQVKEANTLLEKGWKRFPESYKFPYYLGLNHYLWLREREQAIHYFQAAAKLAAPESVQRSAGRALERFDDPEAVFDLFQKFYADASNPREREAMRPLLVHGVFYEVATRINDLVAKHRSEYPDREHAGLDELVRAGYLERVPSDPYGGHLYLDGDGKVRSTVRPSYWWEPKPRP